MRFLFLNFKEIIKVSYISIAFLVNDTVGEATTFKNKRISNEFQIFLCTTLYNRISKNKFNF
jgi:hypothetical protein